MSSSKKSRQPPSLHDDDDNTVARMMRSSMDADILTLLKSQMKMSLEKKNKAKHAKLMRAVRDQLEKLLSTRAGMLEQARNELENGAQEYSTGYAQDLDEIRALWMAIAQRREALTELLSTEEKMVHKLELDREKNSVIHLTQAKADCEEQEEIIASLC
ncbi:hypothetical protein BGY98DRAFT_61028 [Russula aff. rugulosa BPL654]|nr:hypothetical protein BGY98DRAFT_61028 [Russula aff. rugulosa BPL654]